MRSPWTTSLALLMFLFTPTATRECRAAGDKVKTLIVTGFDVKSHQWEESSRMVHSILEDAGGFEVSLSSDKEIFADPKLKDYDVVVLCYGFWEEPEPSEQAKSGLVDYVRGGGSLVALHFACSSFQDWDEYAVLLGRVWKKGVGGHGPYGKFEVNIKDAKHPISRGLSDFEIEDELYAKLTGDAEIQVVASAYSDWSNKVEPLVFVKTYGDGRVVQNLLGHSMDSKRNESYQRLLVNAVEWAATGKVVTH